MPDYLILHYVEWYNYFIMNHNAVILEMKCTISIMQLNHPQTILTHQSVEKLSFTKLVPGDQKFGDPWVRKQKAQKEVLARAFIGIFLGQARCVQDCQDDCTQIIFPL